MSDSWQHQLCKLLEATRICFLATEGEVSPEASMAPFAIDQGDVLIHLSGLARHRSNLERNPRVGMVICTSESKADSPLGLPRISLTGLAERVSEGRQATARGCYLSRIPEAEPLFDFPDFRLFAVKVLGARWVGGFGMAKAIEAKDWYSLFVNPIP